MYLYFIRIENTPTAPNAQHIFALKAESTRNYARMSLLAFNPRLP